MRKGVAMVGRTQREEAKVYVRDVIERATREALRSMAGVIDRERFTRQDVELLLHELLPNARWAAQEAAYTPQRLWEQDPTIYAMAFATVAATILAADRASVQQR
jgi:hypothetical protein